MTSPANGGPMSGGRRRIDKVLADDFIADLEKIEIGDLRERRLEAEQEEADLSYVRRMLQGRMDILRAELARRSGGSEAKIVDHLSQVLSDTGRHDHGLGRFLRVEPSRVDEHRRSVEQVIADVGISGVEGQSDEDIRGRPRAARGVRGLRLRGPPGGAEGDGRPDRRGGRPLQERFGQRRRPALPALTSPDGWA